MNRILTVVEGGPSTASVIDVSRALADILDAEPDLVTAAERGQALQQLISRWPVRSTRSSGETWLTDEAAAEDVAATVAATRSLPPARGLTRHLPSHLIQHCPRLVVAVPPDLGPEHRGLARLLVPIEGQRLASEGLVSLCRRFEASGRRIIGLHMLNKETTPAFADRWQDPSLWSQTFWGKHAPMISDTHVGVGDVVLGVLDALRQYRADAVLLEWNQHFGDDHARVVDDLLRHCTVPVLLIPDHRHAGPSTPWVSVIDLTADRPTTGRPRPRRPGFSAELQQG